MKYIIYIICIMLITMIMVYVGQMKEKNLAVELTNKLYRKCCGKVLKYLEHHGEADISAIKSCIKGATASVLWSRKKAAVNNPAQFVNYVTEGLQKEGKILILRSGSKTIYCLNKNE